jgi:hypothetical protein
LGGLLLATSFNVLFFVAGAAAFMTMVHRREGNNGAWSLLLHKFGSYYHDHTAGPYCLQ